MKNYGFEYEVRLAVSIPIDKLDALMEQLAGSFAPGGRVVGSAQRIGHG